MAYETVLTVSESKRLIARAVANHPAVTQALRDGSVALCKGTTCSLIAEEFLGRKMEHFAYTTGLTIPMKPAEKVKAGVPKENDIILRMGTVYQDGETAFEAAKTMKAGDVIIKGANALNSERNMAGCIVGHPEGGYLGAFIGHVYGKKLKLIIPVGLEKTISGDIVEASHRSFGGSNTLMPMVGTIITEIEALEILCGVNAVQLASGGVRGAEGAVRLLVEGTDELIEDVKNILAEIHGEPQF